jgi:hypothetical protein
MTDSSPYVAGAVDVAENANYERLLQWGKGRTIKVDRVAATGGGWGWTIGLSVVEPVVFSALGRGKTIEDAATQVLDQLETVGVKVP